MAYEKKLWQDRIKDAQGTIVQEGTPFSAGNMNRMEQGIADAHTQLEGANRQTQTLQHGLSVLNGGVNAPVNIQIEGRTLIPQQNNILDPLKYYVLADKKTKLKFADANILSGIAKFTARSERPTLIRVANFEGKGAGSTLENPHKAFYSDWAATTLMTPSQFITEFAGTSPYINVQKLDATLAVRSTTQNGGIASQGFSFDIVQEIERQIGKIPKSTLADKVQWCKDNIEKITCNWHGYGSGPAGNKANLVIWKTNTSTWHTAGQTSHTNNQVTKLLGVSTTTYTDNTPTNNIDANGFIHLLAYTDASDSVTASTINTDYVELEIELKSSAILHAPRVPLYDVTLDHYNAINVTWSEAETLMRYPQVEGATHLQNPYVIAEGENLLPPISEWTTSNAKPIFDSPYSFKYQAAATTDYHITRIPSFPNTDYVLSVDDMNANARIAIRETKKDGTKTFRVAATQSSLTVTFKTFSDTVDIEVDCTALAVGEVSFKNPILSFGTTKKPFVPRNPSYALFETKLGKIGDSADRLFEQDGKYFVRKAVEKDVILDGSLAWVFNVDGVGFKVAQIVSIGSSVIDNTGVIQKFNGSLLKQMIYGGSWSSGDQHILRNTSNQLFVSISDTDSGFGETYTPTADEIKAYFNGWKAKTVDANGKPTAWISLFDGTDAPTQTLDYVKANKAANFIPYKLSYQLATPVVSEIRAEGAISVNGLTQIEVGSGGIVREKVTPKINTANTTYHINIKDGSTGMSTNGAQLKNRAVQILGIYKNNLIDKDWSLVKDTLAHGSTRALIDISKYDSTAEYYVTYVVFDKQLLTNNALNVITQYANNIRTALEDTTKKVEDNTTNISIHANILYDVLKRLKAGGL